MGQDVEFRLAGSSSISQCLTQGDFVSPGQYKISQPIQVESKLIGKINQTKTPRMAGFGIMVL